MESNQAVKDADGIATLHPVLVVLTKLLYAIYICS